LDNAELYNLYSLSGIIVEIIQINEDEWAGHAARVGEVDNTYTVSA
jgi:hypothetical protein